MPAASSEEILREVNPDAIPAEAPPEGVGYRQADVEGIACQFCTKFSPVELSDDGVQNGVCERYEAKVEGDHVSDGFSDNGPALDKEGEEIWDFADEPAVAEIHLANTEQSVDEETGFVIKDVLRTGEWPVIPTAAGKVKQPLSVVRDGVSDRNKGVISLAELVDNFKAQAIPNVQIPLSDDNKDHKNITRVNTGFIKDLWIEDEEEGSRLVAKMEFTEPDIKERVLRGTYRDVSCGIPWGVQSRGKKFGAAVEHVAITNRPFIDGLGPFLAASDQEEGDVEIGHFGVAEGDVELGDLGIAEQTSTKPPISFAVQIAKAQSALAEQLYLSPDYTVTDIVGTEAIVQHPKSNSSWTVPFKFGEVVASGNTTSTGELVASNTSNSSAANNFTLTLSSVKDWVLEEENAGENNDEPATMSGSPDNSDELTKAHRLRELRLSQSSGNGSGGSAMPNTLGIEALDQLELSDEARSAIQSVLDERATLLSRVREKDADTRITELEELGLKERPGALKFYREVFLSDDGGPAVVLLSDEGKEKEQLTALQVLDRFLDGVKGSDGNLNLSDQALASGNDNPPPADASDELPVEERVAAAKQAIYGRK